MFRFTQLLTLVALVGAAILGLSPPACADFHVTLTDVNTNQTLTIYDNGANDGSGNNNKIQYNGTFGNFEVYITATTNSPGGPINGLGVADRLQDVTITTKNDSATPGSDTLTFGVFSDGFTDPGAPGQKLLLTNALASSSIDVGGSGTFTSWANAPFYQADPVTLTDTDIANGIGLKKSALTFTLDQGPYPYTLSNQLGITLDSGSSGQFTGTTTLTSPAPAGIVLALTGLPVLGLGWLRLRKRA